MTPEDGGASGDVDGAPGARDGGDTSATARDNRASGRLPPLRPRATTAAGVARVRDRWRAIALTAVAAGIAWALATLIQPRPYFAPVAAIISLGITVGQPVRRAAELAFGVAVGILVADGIVHVLGVNAVTIGLIVVLAMAAALLFGAGQILVNQAAVSGVLLATIGTPGHASPFTRFFSACIGGAVAVMISALVARDPLEQVGRAAERLLGELAGVLDEVAAALRSGDAEAADAALAHARAVDADAFVDAVLVAHDALRLVRRRELRRLAVYQDAARQVDLAVRNTRVLARTVQTAAVRDVPSDPDLVEAVALLGGAVRALGAHLREPERDSEAQHLAVEAAQNASAVLDHRHDLAANLIVGQIRATAGDLLRGTGLTTREMRVALGPYPGA